MNRKFMNVKAAIAAELQSLPPNTRLPSERDLIMKFGFSRPTIQKALTQLEGEGFLYRRPRQGSFVSDSRLHKQMTKLEGFSKEIKTSGHKPSSRVLSFQRVAATQQVAEKLQIPIGSQVYHLLRSRLQDGEPIILDDSHFILPVLEGLSSVDGIASLYGFIEEKGFKIAFAEQIISACNADALIAEQLCLSLNAPVVAIDMVSFLADGRAFEYSVSYKNPEKYVLSIKSYR